MLRHVDLRLDIQKKREKKTKEMSSRMMIDDLRTNFSDLMTTKYDYVFLYPYLLQSV